MRMEAKMMQKNCAYGAKNSLKLQFAFGIIAVTKLELSQGAA